MSPAEKAAKSRRTNSRESITAVVTFLSLAIASIFDFRDDVELLVAFQGALIALAHRVLA